MDILNFPIPDISSVHSCGSARLPSSRAHAVSTSFYVRVTVPWAFTRLSFGSVHTLTILLPIARKRSTDWPSYELGLKLSSVVFILFFILWWRGAFGSYGPCFPSAIGNPMILHIRENGGSVGRQSSFWLVCQFLFKVYPKRLSSLLFIRANSLPQSLNEYAFVFPIWGSACRRRQFQARSQLGLRGVPIPRDQISKYTSLSNVSCLASVVGVRRCSKLENRLL